MIEAQRLKKALETVAQVHAQRNHRTDIRGGDPDVVETRDDHGVDVFPAFGVQHLVIRVILRVRLPEREVKGRPVRVEAEDNAQVLLDFGAGTLAVVTCGFTMQQYRSPALEVYGTAGTIQMLGDDWDPEGYELFQNSAGCWQVFKETAPDWPWTDGLNHFVDGIRSGTKPLVTPRHARHVLEIMLKAQEAGREGRSLALESTFAPLIFAESGEQEAAHRQHDRTREH